MPLYEYRCPKCDKEFELLIRGEEQPQCPDCGGKKLRRLLSAPAVHASSASRSGSSLPINQPTCTPDMCRSGKCPFQ
jgi:putative FmdB family regulatory protein